MEKVIQRNLACSDLNTKFFHTSTIIKRRSNAINFFKTSEGGWLSDREKIGGTFVNHFANLFASSSSAIDEELAELFPLSYQLKKTFF